MSSLEDAILSGMSNPEETLRLLDRLDAENSLYRFIQLFWDIIEPGREFKANWSIEAICDHLEAVSDGRINRLLINVPPGCMKSLTTACFWPAWVWGPQGMPHLRFIDASYSQGLTIRDNQRMLRLCSDPRYKALWNNFNLDLVGAVKLANDKTGWKLATSVGGIGTGERCDAFIIDDAHNVKESESSAKIAEAILWFNEVVPTRMNDPEKSAILVIMQRVSEGDVSGEIISRELGYTHLCLPMEYDSRRHCITSIGFSDPRTQDGELLFPERFPREVVERDKRIMGKWAVASQFQQEPSPRGGGIIPYADWKVWPPGGDEEFDAQGRPLKPLELPVMGYVVASLDVAMTEKEENDWSALTIWGCWRDERKLPKVMLMYAWRGRLEFGKLVSKVIEICERFKANPVNLLLIENKSNGISVAQEIRRQMYDVNWVTKLWEPKGDKVDRAYAIQSFFEAGIIYAPDRTWATMVMEECAKFPKAKHDDLVDTVTMCLNYLRQTGQLSLVAEAEADLAFEAQRGPGKRHKLPYDV